MKMKCPVCLNPCDSLQMTCDMCGYPHLSKTFKSEEEQASWEATVVSSCKAIWMKRVMELYTTKTSYAEALHEINDLQDRIEELEEENEDLSVNFERIEAAAASLKKSCEKYQTSYNEVCKICDDYKLMVQIIGDREKALQQSYNELKEKYIELLLSR